MLQKTEKGLCDKTLPFKALKLQSIKEHQFFKITFEAKIPSERKLQDIVLIHVSYKNSGTFFLQIIILTPKMNSEDP